MSFCEAFGCVGVSAVSHATRSGRGGGTAQFNLLEKPLHPMYESSIRTLCHEASRILQLAEPDAMHDHRRIELLGVDIAVFYDEELVSDRIFCYVDLGPIPEGEVPQVLANLMTLNFLVGARSDGVFGLDPSSGNALMIVHVLFSDALTPDVFAHSLMLHAARAASVRRSVVERTPEDFDLQDTLERQFGEADEVVARAMA
ncbi:MAG: hypothetical protein EOO22_01205 [Comamonadaceae bacterium]|nr:MAG: hypothetical protein EOO22_01205 [Comamonadaceae bacterium]